MNTKLSDAYRLLRDVIAQNKILNCDLASIEAEILGADEELSRDEYLFDKRLTQLASSIHDVTSTCESFVILRVSALNLSTLFSNLADAIESVVVANRDQLNGTLENHQN